MAASYFDLQRNNKLMALSEVVVGGQLHYKLDLIANISLNGFPYCTVYRRYNSPYEYLLEDTNGEFLCHKDYTVRQSLSTSLTHYRLHDSDFTVLNASTFKYNTSIINSAHNILDMRWSDICKIYSGVILNLGGIPYNYYTFPQMSSNNLNTETTFNTSYDTPAPTALTPAVKSERLDAPPDAPLKLNKSDLDAADALVDLSREYVTPQVLFPETLSGKKRTRIDSNCYCMFDSEDDFEYTEDTELDTTVDETKYTILRNGTMIPKVGV
jgi:hypothetical protein